MYRIRFIFVLLKSLLSKPKALSDDFELTFWAIPLIDTDYSRLFTQTYALYMGLARWNFLFNSEFKTAALKKSMGACYHRRNHGLWQINKSIQPRKAGYTLSALE